MKSAGVSHDNTIIGDPWQERYGNIIIEELWQRKRKVVEQGNEACQVLGVYLEAK